MISIIPMPQAPHIHHIGCVPQSHPYGGCAHATAGVKQADAARAVTVFTVFSVIASSLLLFNERHRSCHAISAWLLVVQFKMTRHFPGLTTMTAFLFKNAKAGRSSFHVL
jgi:hypothetical protein